MGEILNDTLMATVERIREGCSISNTAFEFSSVDNWGCDCCADDCRGDCSEGSCRGGCRFGD